MRSCTSPGKIVDLIWYAQGKKLDHEALHCAFSLCSSVLCLCALFKLDFCMLFSVSELLTLTNCFFKLCRFHNQNVFLYCIIFTLRKWISWSVLDFILFIYFFNHYWPTLLFNFQVTSEKAQWKLGEINWSKERLISRKEKNVFPNYPRDVVLRLWKRK